MIFYVSERPKFIVKSPTLIFGGTQALLGRVWVNLSDAEKTEFKQ